LAAALGVEAAALLTFEEERPTDGIDNVARAFTAGEKSA
jgi:hypothetical protein